MVLIPTFQFIVTSGGHVGYAVCFCGRRSSKFPNIELFFLPPSPPLQEAYIWFVLFCYWICYLSPIRGGLESCWISWRQQWFCSMQNLTKFFRTPLWLNLFYRRNNNNNKTCSSCIVKLNKHAGILKNTREVQRSTSRRLLRISACLYNSTMHPARFSFLYKKKEKQNKKTKQKQKQNKK